VVALLALLALAAPFSIATPSTATADTQLQISVWPQGYASAEVHRYRLACAPAQGTVPRPGRACTMLSRLGAAAFAPTPKTTVCTDIWGGPAKARVRGVVDGQAIDARLSLVNGCEISRWNRLAAVVPQPRD